MVVIEMYISLIPVILAGVFNMLWVKLPYLSFLTIPIDNNKCFFDGKRILGDNKTWKGFFGMIILGVISNSIWGEVCRNFSYLNSHNYLYRNHENLLIYNVIIGFFLGLAYVVLELPNSFIKRRIDIMPGKSGNGFKGIFIIIDQADSLFGCVLVIAVVYKMSIIFYLIYVFLGAITHILINILLYHGKLRRNMF